MTEKKEYTSMNATSRGHVGGSRAEWSPMVICLALAFCVMLGSLFALTFYKIDNLERELASDRSVRSLFEQCIEAKNAGILTDSDIIESLKALGSRPRRSTLDEPQGCACPPGPKGDWGPRGERGRRGPEGRKGKDGEKGEKGDIGPGGLKGEIGVKGEPGLPGIEGPKGDLGPPGVDGINGTDGLPGRKGDRGQIGPQGLPGLEGPRGQRGLIGPRGPSRIGGDSSHLTSLPSLGLEAIEAIHVRGIPDNIVTGLSRLGDHGVLNSWEATALSDSFRIGTDGNITVARDGYYFIYTNVLFYDSGPYYGATTNINGETFLRCIGSRRTRQESFGPCSTSGVARLKAGDRVSIVGDFPRRDVDMRPETTYFGLIRLR